MFYRFSDFLLFGANGRWIPSDMMVGVPLRKVKNFCRNFRIFFFFFRCLRKYFGLRQNRQKIGILWTFSKEPEKPFFGGPCGGVTWPKIPKPPRISWGHPFWALTGFWGRSDFRWLRKVIYETISEPIYGGVLIRQNGFWTQFWGLWTSVFWPNVTLPFTKTQ